jgi:hypothetical protein
MTQTTYGAARSPGRGYTPTYRAGATCPSCCGAQWHVGRFSAQCARCSTALPFAEPRKA